MGELRGNSNDRRQWWGAAGEIATGADPMGRVAAQPLTLYINNLFGEY